MSECGGYEVRVAESSASEPHRPGRDEQGSAAATYVRFQGLEPGPSGYRPGIFFLVNGLARDGSLTAAQERFRRANNDWYDAAYRNPSHLDPTVYDQRLNPGAVAWFKHTSTELLARVDGYLEILDAHGVGYERLLSVDPGRIVYDDEHQVVVVPRSRDGRDRSWSDGRTGQLGPAVQLGRAGDHRADGG